MKQNGLAKLVEEIGELVCAPGLDDDGCAPAQPPEPVEPSDPVPALFDAWSATPQAVRCGAQGVFRGGYRAGLAAEAAARADLRSKLDRTLATVGRVDQERANEVLAHEATKAELERAREILNALKNALVNDAGHQHVFELVEAARKELGET